MFSKMKEQKGFTLIELITVIIIIGILSAMAVPKFINLSDQANAAKCKSNQAALESAATMAYAESAGVGNPAYPAAIGDLAAFMTSGYTPNCADGVTALAYNVAGNGEVTCPNHVR